MTHKIKIVSLLMVSAILFFVGCKKNNPENETPDEPSIETMDEVIPEEILQLLDNCPIVNYQDPSVFGFNGKSDNPLDDMFAAMCKVAMHLTDRNKEYGTGDNKQKGLAYVYGYGYPSYSNKDYRIRRRGYDSVCTDSLYGIDCSGFIAHVMDSVGIHVISGKSLFERKAWEQADYFKKLNHRTLKSNYYTGLVRVEEIENVDSANIRNGDIIINNKNKASHIGIIFKKPGVDTLIMFQSAGHPDSSCHYNKHKHGPIQRKMTAGTLEGYFTISSGNARLLRITIDSNWVDLGLPSGKLWATRNIGANSPEDYGYYVEWANLASAEAEWAETVGFGCHTPTLVEWQELIDTNNTTSTWITQNSTFPWTPQNSVNGRLFTSKKNGETLFLPAAGFLHEGNIYNTGQYADLGFYWTSTPSENNPNNAWYIRFNSIPDEKPVWNNYLRLFGLSVRAVRSPN